MEELEKYEIRCVLCGINCLAYAMDVHVGQSHDVDLSSSIKYCAWCGATLGNTYNTKEKAAAWYYHLLQCSSYAAWCLSGAEVWNKK